MPAYKAIPAITESTLANGDLLYWHTDEYKRLPVGGYQSVLIATGSTISWQSPIAAFYCSLYEAFTGMAANTFIDLEPSSASYDPQSLWNNVTNRVTATRNMQVLITMMAQWIEPAGSGQAASAGAQRLCRARVYDTTPAHAYDALWASQVAVDTTLGTDGLSTATVTFPVYLPSGYSVGFQQWHNFSPNTRNGKMYVSVVTIG